MKESEQLQQMIANAKTQHPERFEKFQGKLRNLSQSIGSIPELSKIQANLTNLLQAIDQQQ